MLAVRIAGWAFIVSRNSSSGPLKHNSLRAKPSVSSAFWKISRAAAETSTRLLPMPTNWEP